MGLDGFVPYPEKLSGWNSTLPNFAVLIDEVQPKVILEVGTWLGASAIHMAKLAPQAHITCIDTWLGSSEFYIDQERNLLDELMLEYGYPGVYYQFISNILHADVWHQITPLPLPSLAAARVLKARNVQADLIYIDGSHDEDDVYADLVAYYPLLREGGIIFGDDYKSFIGVSNAVKRFGKPFTTVDEDWQWVIRT